VFLTGQIALDEAGELVGQGDAGAQAEQVWQNIECVVDALGADLGDVVKLTTFATSLDDLPQIAAARARRFAEGSFPASTFLVVAGLARPDYLVEIEATVMLDERRLDALGVT
jgi:enamine deaminase RidA (YjgF/YER057c/UK114 family)